LKPLAAGEIARELRQNGGGHLYRAHFTHTDSGGTVKGAGTWRADELLNYQSYGCGIVHFPDGDV